MPDLDLDLVRCFLTVAENGGFTAAAQRLHLSQSAVSLKIQRLEGLLDRPVFVRTSRSLTLTAEGEMALGYARRLLALNQEMIQRVAQPAVAAILRLGVVQQFGQQFLPELLSQFKQRHPNIRLSVEVGMSADLLLALEEDRFDLVLAAAGFVPSSAAKVGGFTRESVILREPLVWVQSATSAIDPKADPVPLTLFTAPCGFRRIAFDLLEKAGRSWQTVYSSTSLASLQAAVQADLGITLLGKSCVLPGMKIISPKAGLPALPETAIALYRRKSAPETPTQSLSTFITQAVARWKRTLPSVARS